jgi:hypothetical protein
MTRVVKQDSIKLDNVVIEAETGEYTVAEIKHSTRIQKSVTPKGTIDWYIKWAASICALLAVSFRSSGIPELHLWDVALSWLGAVGWAYVGFMWKDRALVLLNGVIGLMLFGALLRLLFAQ